MITSLNGLLGMPVIWQDQRLGLVERAVPDAQAARLDGLVVRRGIGMAKWVSCEDVLVLGRRCVVLAAKPVGMPENEKPEMRRVFLTTGECVGQVTDAFVDGNTLRLAALEVCRDSFCRLVGQRSYAVDFRVSSAGEAGGVVAAQLLSWAQLKKHLEGEDDE